MFSKRIEEIAKYLVGLDSLVDIGTDHAYLPIYAIKNMGLKKALATDISPKALKIAQKNIEKYDLASSISTLVSDGLDKVEGEYDALVIAGMGGKTILDILEKGKDKLVSFKKIIVSAHRDSELVRRFMALNSYQIVMEKMVFEYKYYEIIIFEKTDGKIQYSDLEYRYGPILLEDKEQVFLDCYQEELKRLSQVDSQYVLDRIKELENILKK